MPPALVLAPSWATPFVVRVETTRRFHIRYEIGGRSVDDGRCGIDDNWVRVALDALEDIDADRLCRYCFPGDARE